MTVGSFGDELDSHTSPNTPVAYEEGKENRDRVAFV